MEKLIGIKSSLMQINSASKMKLIRFRVRTSRGLIQKSINRITQCSASSWGNLASLENDLAFSRYVGLMLWTEIPFRWMSSNGKIYIISYKINKHMLRWIFNGILKSTLDQILQSTRIKEICFQLKLWILFTAKSRAWISGSNIF